MLGKIGAILGAAKTVADVFATDEQKQQLAGAVTNAISDGIEGIITGTRTLEEWAEITSNSVDKIVAQKKQEEDLRFVDGFICFEIPKNRPHNVIISFQLYFMDSNDEWKKVEGSSDVRASNFTDESIEEIKSQGTIKFSVEE